MEKKYLIIMDHACNPTFNYEIIDSDQDPQFVDSLTKLIGKPVSINRDRNLYDYKVGRKEYSGRVVTIFKDGKKLFMKSGNEYKEFFI